MKIYLVFELDSEPRYRLEGRSATRLLGVFIELEVSLGGWELNLLSVRVLLNCWLCLWPSGVLLLVIWLLLLFFAFLWIWSFCIGSTLKRYILSQVLFHWPSYHACSLFYIYYLYFFQVKETRFLTLVCVPSCHILYILDS